MHDYRTIYLVRRGIFMLAFDFPEIAEQYARKIGGSWEPVRMYLSGKEPRCWMIYTGECQPGHEPVYGSYLTSEVEGLPHEDEPAFLMAEPHFTRAIGTDQAEVHRLIEEWRTSEWSTS